MPTSSHSATWPATSARPGCSGPRCAASSAASAWFAAGSPPFPPELAGSRHGEKRARRMLTGETTKRSDLDPDRLCARLQAHGVERLHGEPSVWVVLDGSDLRKPHATAMEHLQRVRKADGTGTVPGYVTLNALGMAPGKRGLLFH